MVLVVTDIPRVPIEALAHLENAGRLSVLTPEVFGNLWNGVYSDSIEVELVNNVSDPINEVLSYIRIVLVEIRKACQPAVLY